MIAIFVLERADGEPLNAWLQDFDLEARDGLGRLWTCEEVGMAKRFESTEEAFLYWQRQSETRPLRDTLDGKPNKPFTAYTIEIRVVP